MIIEINADNPEPRKVRRAVDALEAGEIIGYPTDTVYGLGCDLFNKRAIDRLYQVKGMDHSQHLAFVCHGLADVARYAVVHDAQYRVLKRHTPGPYVFVLQATREVPRIVHMPRKTVGIRVPAHEVALALARELGRPIISTTAARRGEDPNPDPSGVASAFKGLAMVLDAGPGGLVPSTVIDLTGDSPVIVRRGAGDAEAFE